MARHMYQVKELSRIAGISVRTLHHYEEIGLLVPTQRTESGYRLYDDQGLLRLQQILVARELGLPLERIRRSLDDPTFDERRSLREHRKALEERALHTAQMIRAIDKALTMLDQKETETKMDMKEIFEGFDPTKREAEAESRWGETDTHRESMMRTKRYTKEDWQTFKAEQASIYADARAALNSGKTPDHPEVAAIAERHRGSVERWFYPCSKQMHRGLADLYEADPRFAANIDKAGEGLTAFLVAAIRAA